MSDAPRAPGRPDPPDPVALAALLREVPLFAALPADTLERLVREGRTFALGTGDHVFRQGEPGDSLYVVLDGEVAITRDAPGEPVRRPIVLGPREFFGEMGVIEGEDRSASARANRPTRLLELGKGLLAPLLATHPLLAVMLRAAVIRRHGSNVSSTVDLAQRREIRTRMDTPVELVLPDGSRHPSRLENLSPGGASLTGLPEAWTPNRAVEIELAMKGLPRPIPLKAIVAWRDGSTGGLAFRSRTPEAEELLRKALRRATTKEG